MAGEFFAAVDSALSGSAPGGASSGSGTFAAAGAGPGGAVGDRAMPAVYVDAPRAGSSNDFLRGVLVGAGLVLAGVVAGVVAGRAGSRQG
jgi:hypothetical protein